MSKNGTAQTGGGQKDNSHSLSYFRQQYDDQSYQFVQIGGENYKVKKRKPLKKRIKYTSYMRAQTRRSFNCTTTKKNLRLPAEPVSGYLLTLKQQLKQKYPKVFKDDSSSEQQKQEEQNYQNDEKKELKPQNAERWGNYSQFRKFKQKAKQQKQAQNLQILNIENSRRNAQRLKTTRLKRSNKDIDENKNIVSEKIIAILDDDIDQIRVNVQNNSKNKQIVIDSD